MGYSGHNLMGPPAVGGFGGLPFGGFGGPPAPPAFGGNGKRRHGALGQGRNPGTTS